MKNLKSEGDMQKKEGVLFRFLTGVVIDTLTGFSYNKLDCTIIL